MTVLVCDNYDSFTFNLVQYLGELGATMEVARNDEVTIADVAALGPAAVLISPGPGMPQQAGISLELVAWCARSSTPLLGVCLGHQAIAEAFGARIVRAARVMHGKTSDIRHDGRGVFAGVANPFEAMRYHSLVVDEASVPESLEVTSHATDDGAVMGLRHRMLPIEGVQFHPESVLTSQGVRIVENFLASAWIAPLRVAVAVPGDRTPFGVLLPRTPYAEPT